MDSIQFSGRRVRAVDKTSIFQMDCPIRLAVVVAIVAAAVAVGLERTGKYANRTDQKTTPLKCLVSPVCACIFMAEACAG